MVIFFDHALQDLKLKSFFLSEKYTERERDDVEPVAQFDIQNHSSKRGYITSTYKTVNKFSTGRYKLRKITCTLLPY